MTTRPRTNTVSLERIVDATETERLLERYKQSIDPLATIAIARHILTDEEFRAGMSDRSLLKFIAWDEQSEPCGMLAVATDLESVPWISPRFAQARWPEAYERGRIFYILTMFVLPTHQGGPWAEALAEACIRAGALGGFMGINDDCTFNTEVLRLPRMIERVAARVCDLEVTELDRQTFWSLEITHVDRSEERLRSDPVGAIGVDLTMLDDVDVDLVAAEEAEERARGTQRLGTGADS